MAFFFFLNEIFQKRNEFFSRPDILCKLSIDERKTKIRSSQHVPFVPVAAIWLSLYSFPPIEGVQGCVQKISDKKKSFFFGLHLQSARVWSQPPRLMVPSSAALTHHQNQQASAFPPLQCGCSDRLIWIWSMTDGSKRTRRIYGVGRSSAQSSLLLSLLRRHTLNIKKIFSPENMRTAVTYKNKVRVLVSLLLSYLSSPTPKAKFGGKLDWFSLRSSSESVFEQKAQAQTERQLIKKTRI